MTTTRAGIAITALSLRLPGASTPEEFWQLLVDGTDRTAPVSERRRELAGAPHWHDTIGEIEDIECFDADFFGIDGSEATFMDPQHRVVMEVAHDAVGEAGLLEASGSPTARRYSVFMAMSTNAYYPLVCRHMDEHGTAAMHPRTVMNNINSALAARVSHQYNLTGPVMAVDTACSSFLAALVQGADSIRHQGCEGAVVGGVNLLSAPYTTLLCSCGGITTSEPVTRVFDERAAGTLVGEGAVVCVLEREDVARRKNRRILGLLRGYAINNDGASLNIMAPNPRGQAEVIRDCYGSEVDHTRVGYVETHGTGTRIGDPIELNALGQVYRREDFGDEKVGVGSVKTNIGHLLSAAGGAGLAKLLLSLRHATMAPVLHLEQLNPLLELERTPFDVVTEPRPWPAREGQARMGAVSSLGLGGTNVHVVVEEAEPPRRVGQVDHALLCLSAASEPALARMLGDVGRRLAVAAPEEHRDLAMSLARFRPSYRHRAVARIDSTTQSLVDVRTSVVEHPVRRVLLRPSPRATEHEERLRTLVVGRVRQSGDEAGRAELAVFLGREDDRDEPGLLCLPEAATEVEHAAALFLRGCLVNWEHLFPDGSGSLLDLPPYPFDRKPYWLDR